MACMEDMIQQYTKAATELRELIREAHAVLKDLRLEEQKARNAMKQYENEAIERASKRAVENEEKTWRKIREEIFTEFLESVDRINDTLLRAQENAAGLMADSARTLALAVAANEPSAIGEIARISRDTQRSFQRRIREAESDRLVDKWRAGQASKAENRP